MNALLRARARRDDTGSLALAMLLVLVGIGLSALLLPVVVGQVGSTRREQDRVHALNAAQSGLDVVMAHIRATDDGTGTGVLAELPCGPFTGRVGAGTARYSVSIDYLPTDPKGMSDAWITANRIPCAAGGGTLGTPMYALLRAQGTDSASGAFTSARVLQATYTFQTTNQNIAGGLVHVYKTATSTDMCLDAGSSSPLAGTNLQIQPCSAGSMQQTFAYTNTLNLVLTSSKLPSMPLGMCVDADNPQVLNEPVQLQPCAGITSPDQQWSLNDSANFEGTKDGKTLDGYCLNVQTPNMAGSVVVLGSTAAKTCKQGYDNKETFSPAAAVGAGASGAANSQLVNFAEFGRCLDVTEQNVNYGYLIAWPCKQAPDPANVSWNQKWNLPSVPAKQSSGTGRITTSPVAGLYCLHSPGSTLAGQYVSSQLCPVVGLGPDYSWTVYTDTGDYATSYRIKDGYGYCLQPTDPNATPPDLYPKGLLISKLVVAPCSSSLLQKWNAPPNIQQSLPLHDIGEK